MRVEPAKVGARGADSLQFSQAGTAAQAAALKADGIEFFVGYLGAITADRLKSLLAAGLAFMPVTFGGAYGNGPADEVAELRALGIPAGASVWLDLEGLAAFHADPVALAKAVNDWCVGISAGGWMPCLYVGVPQPFTSAELYALKTVRYWQGQGSVRDRHDGLAEPTCGWCMKQTWPSVPRGGVSVDIDNIGEDYRQRVPAWVVAA